MDELVAGLSSGNADEWPDIDPDPPCTLAACGISRARVERREKIVKD